MFGLMRRAGRLPYCGTCKTLGSLYGQRTRALLNHDTVFLAEMLLEASSEPRWSRAFRSFNCLALPRENEAIPPAIEFAATATVVLAHFQIQDHQADSKRFRWRIANKLFSPAYRSASARMKRWRFPLGEVEEILDTQTTREANPESLAQVAEPTSVATALVFSHGARVAGTPDAAATLYRIGHRFGYLAYVLDAYEDRDRDRRTGDFNPLLTWPAIDARAEILGAVAELEHELSPALAARLRQNVEERLGLRFRIVCGGCRKSAGDRWRDALSFARSIRAKEQTGFLKGAAVVASVAMIAFLFPHHARSAESWRQCMGVGLNLMAIGTVFASVSIPPEGAAEAAKAAKKGGCDWCCCDCCDGCDCCDCCSGRDC